MITLMYFIIGMNWYSKTVMAVACSNNFGNQTELLMFLVVTTASVVDAVLICII